MSLNRHNILMLVLAVSVTVNLFFVGAVTARYVDRPERPMEPPNMRWVMRAVDDSTRENLRPRLMQYGEILRPLRGEMFRAQREVNELLAAEPVDTQAVAAAFERLRAANLRYQEVTHQQLAQVFAALSPEQRVQAFRFMSERRNPDGERNRNGDSRNEGSRNADSQESERSRD
jgi:uncharacterized membrane protein